MLAVGLSGCNGKGTSSGIPLASQDLPTAEVACVESVIDPGTKGAGAAASTRGTISDVKIDPRNSREAFAYYDAAAAGLKFTYWNGATYVHELVAGAPVAANFLSMVFLSTGIPVIAWTTGGTDVLLAIRSSSTATSAATWGLRVFSAVATAARTIKLEVTPTDMVGGVYYTAATSGRLKMLLCSSNCASTANYTNMSGATDYVGNDSGTALANQVSVGFAWCGADTDLDGDVDNYYPAAVYARTTPSNSTRYTMCPSATPSACLTGAGWTVNAGLLTAAATANLASALHIDATVPNDPPKVLTAKPSSGVRAYLAGTPASPVLCRNVISGTSFTESTQVLGAATTTASAWLNLLRSSDGRLHAVMNESTTNVRYFNTTSGNLANWNTFWNTGNGYLNTTTTAGVGAAVIEPQTSAIYTSYFGNTAAYRYNLLLNKVTTIPANSALVESSNTAVNTTGHLVLTASVNRNIALASASSGELGVAYVDYAVGTSATGVLRYAHRTGRLLSSPWSVYTIPSVIAPASPALQFDHNDRPWISYYDQTNLRYYLVTNSAADGSGVWTSFVHPVIATAPAFPNTNDTAIAMWSSGGVKHPVLVFLNNSATRSVIATRFNSTSLVWGTAVSVATATTGLSGLSAAGDDTGRVVVAFLDRTTGAFLRYAASSDGAGSFTTPLTVGAVTGAGQGTDIKINSLTGSPILTYQDRANNRMYLANCAGTPAACATGGWTTRILDYFTGVSGLTISTTGNESLLNTSIALRDDGAYDIFYTHGPAASGDLKRIKVDANENLGLVATWAEGLGNEFGTALHFGVQGFHVSSVITPDDQLATAYVGQGNLLVQRTCDLNVQD